MQSHAERRSQAYLAVRLEKGGHLVGLNHHAAVVADHLAGSHNVHRADPRPQATHLLCPAKGRWQC